MPDAAAARASCVDCLASGVYAQYCYGCAKLATPQARTGCVECVKRGGVAEFCATPTPDALPPDRDCFHGSYACISCYTQPEVKNRTACARCVKEMESRTGTNSDKAYQCHQCFLKIDDRVTQGICMDECVPATLPSGTYTECYGMCANPDLTAGRNPARVRECVDCLIAVNSSSNFYGCDQCIRSTNDLPNAAEARAECIGCLKTLVGTSWPPQYCFSCARLPSVQAQSDCAECLKKGGDFNVCTKAATIT
ncbi:hypothetical protein HYH03_017765 [Edaphochlamys debaryana]|uniref:Uncharacterized protein n=1 Tax=Edaphochlamys debaryana TaxID=47281 RepID=A0A835XJE8_9CHLO|nr:hypothetical protein HYH03_017765 [Edaphochlamys debaryana]|eukprot:KAG2483366.1 hypothetical protein HYH03_017765 [Edaphochlamys debaryana]